MFISDNDEEVTIFIGDSTTLDCSVTGTPVPGVAWSKVNQFISF